MTSYADGFADGVEYAVRVVAEHMRRLAALPRTEPSDRRGQVVALGRLLEDLAPGIEYADAVPVLPPTPTDRQCRVSGDAVRAWLDEYVDRTEGWKHRAWEALQRLADQQQEEAVQPEPRRGES